MSSCDLRAVRRQAGAAAGARKMPLRVCWGPLMRGLFFKTSATRLLLQFCNAGRTLQASYDSYIRMFCIFREFQFLAVPWPVSHRELMREEPEKGPPLPLRWLTLIIEPILVED